MNFARLHFGRAAQHSIAGSTQGRWREGAQCRNISHSTSTNEGKSRASDRFTTVENFRGNAIVEQLQTGAMKEIAKQDGLQAI